MIVFVDNEHVSGYAQPWGEKIMAARVRIKYELKDMSGDQCLIVRWDRISPDLLRRLDARALFISGNSAPADDYPVEAQTGLRQVVLAGEWPVFGFCGGHQVVGEVYGAPLEAMGALDDGDQAQGESADFAPGMKPSSDTPPSR